MCALDVGLIVEHEGAALSADEVLRLVEAQCRAASERPEWTPAVRAEQAVSVVLDELGGPAEERVAEAVDVAADACVVHGHNRADALVHCRFDCRRVETERLRLDVDEAD